MPLEQWHLDERAAAGPEHLDPAYVATYEAKSGVDVDAELAFLREHGLHEAATLVDLGAGSGALAAAAAPYCRRVVVVDPSPAMVAVLRSRGLEAVEAGFLTYEHTGDAPSVIYSRNALHHLPDFWKGIALARMHDLLVSGGTFLLRDLVYSFDPWTAPLAIEEWLARAAPSPDRGWTRAELEVHVRTEHSTYTWLLEPLLERVGFEIRDASHRDGVYSTYVCAKP